MRQIEASTPVPPAPPASEPVHAAADTVLAAARVSTFDGQRPLTGATGFFFARGERRFLVTSRHVVIDEATGHHPDRLEVEVHLEPKNLTQSIGLSMLLFRKGRSVWRQARDTGGEIDVAVVEIEPSALPEGAAIHWFTPEHLMPPDSAVEIGSALLVVGFPLGFHDALHHLPVVRQAAVASPYGLRFQGQGYFLTDARTHRGTSGAPVVMRWPDSPDALPWKLLGVHSSRMDMSSRDLKLDESLGLNCAWYADVLMTLTR